MAAGWANTSKTVSAVTDAELKAGSDTKHRRSNQNYTEQQRKWTLKILSLSNRGTSWSPSGMTCEDEILFLGNIYQFVEYLQFVFKIYGKTSWAEVYEEPVLVGHTRYHLSQHTSLVDVHIPQDQVLEEYVDLYFEDLNHICLIPDDTEEAVVCEKLVAADLFPCFISRTRWSLSNTTKCGSGASGSTCGSPLCHGRDLLQVSSFWSPPLF